MKILIDTNVILDVLMERKPFAENAAKIFKLCEVKKIAGYISALSVPNIVYIMRKELDAEKISEILRQLSLIFSFVDLKALQSVAAGRIHADYIVTRNVKDFNGSKVMAVKPEELLERI